MPHEKKPIVKEDRNFYMKVLSDLYYLNGELRALTPVITEEFFPIGRSVKCYCGLADSLKEIIRENCLSKPIKKSLMQNVGLLEESSSKIIHSLQFQDIIEQKLQHIVDVHQELIEELYREQALHKNQVEIDDLKNINKVAQINSAQLNFIIKEYEDALTCIFKNKKAALLALKKIMSILSEYKDCFNKEQIIKSSKLFMEVQNELQSPIVEDSKPSNFMIAVSMLVKVLQNLFIVQSDEPFIIEGKWKKILEMYTIHSEKLVFEQIACMHQNGANFSKNDNIQDFEQF